MGAVVRFENVSKVYRLGRRRRHTLKETLLSSYRRRKGESFFALRDVSFEVEKGEVLGIIGDNGSGKSTILKIAAGITQPTSGLVEKHGRISALLEVGAGFHPDMTGRENIYLSGTILGISRSELDRRFDEIVAFAELEEFIDTPVKFYSSGMYMRLGFSIAMNVDPEILLIDEIFSVGDNVFQHKCTQYMSRVQKSGKTILFISHNMRTIQTICTRVMLLDHGRIVIDGPPYEAAFEYMKHIAERQLTRTEEQAEIGGGFYNRDGSQEVVITGVRFLNERGEEQTKFDVCDPIAFAIDFENRGRRKPITVSLSLYDTKRRHLFTTTSSEDGCKFENLPPKGTVKISVPELCLIPGMYFFCVGFFDYETDFLAPDIREHIVDLRHFQHAFMIKRSKLSTRASGIAYLRRSWSLEPGA